MFRFTAALIAVLVGHSGTALAASIIELRGSDSGEAINNDIEINGELVRLTVRDGATVSDIHFNSDTGTAHIIDHEERSYIELTEQGIEQMGEQMQGMISQVQAQLEQSMAGMSEEQKAQIGNLFGNLGLAQGTAPAPAPGVARFDSDGTMTQVNGIPCAPGVLSVDNQPPTQMCVATRTDIGLPEGDYETLRKLVDFGSRIAGKVSTMFPTASAVVPSFDVDTINGVPVEIRDSTMHVAVTSIRQESRPPITLPEDYTRRANPFLGH
jgi:hypothetical protein